MARTSFLFWNTHRKPLAHLVAALASDYRVDVVILLEDAMSREVVLKALNSNGPSRFRARESPERKSCIYTRFSKRFLNPIFENESGRLTMWELVLPARAEILLVVAHAPSKLHASDDDQTLEGAQIADTIRRLEENAGHNRTVLVGDLNMNPFEAGVVGAKGLHAVMSQAVAKRMARKVKGVSYPFFYNPMWSRMGDGSVGPCGTFYYEGSRHVEHFWHTFDQVLLRPELLDRFDIGRLVVPTKAGKIPLVTSNGRPDKKLASDHLPVVFELDL
jgi:hypothetical protein